jgi:hypothetical protein
MYSDSPPTSTNGSGGRRRHPPARRIHGTFAAAAQAIYSPTRHSLDSRGTERTIAAPDNHPTTAAAATAAEISPVLLLLLLLWLSR